MLKRLPLHAHLTSQSGGWLGIVVITAKFKKVVQRLVQGFIDVVTGIDKSISGATEFSTP